MSRPAAATRGTRSDARATTTRPLRVAFLTNFVSPYRRPVFEALQETPDWNFRVFTNAETEFDRNWTVDTSRLDVRCSRNWEIKRQIQHAQPIEFTQEVTLHVPYGLFFDLWSFRPDVIVSTELGPRSLIAMSYAKLRRVPLLLWSYHSRSSAHAGGRSEGLKRWLLRQSAGAIGMGQQARDVLRDRGVSDDRIHDALNAADHETLVRRLAASEIQRDALAVKRRIAGPRKVALVVGNLVPRKGVAEILDAWGALSETVRDDWRLVFCGDGPLRELVERAPGTHAAGSIPADQMADWYALADLHVFPTLTDVWGLVVNEASACGLPSLCSIHAACSDDMIEDGEDGLLFDPTRPDALRNALHDALTRPDLEELGQAAREKVRRFSVGNMAESFRRAVESVRRPVNS